MLADLYNTDRLDLYLYSDDDDDQDPIYKKWLEDLVTGTTPPSKVASDIDAWIVNDADQRFKEFMKRPDPRNLTPEEENHGISITTIAPDARGYIERVFTSVAKLCFAFPPFEPGQNRIIEFLEALRAMPQHQAFDGVPPTEEEKKNGEYDNVVTLWPFWENWMALAEIFQREADDISYPCSDIEVPGSETRIRWRNWQSAIARITTLGFIDCGFLCALGDVLSSSTFYPNQTTTMIRDSKRISGDMIAGMQWLQSQQEGRFVFMHCMRVKESDDPKVMWTIQRWLEWKFQFTWMIIDEDSFNLEERQIAQQVLDRMLVLEKTFRSHLLM